eukprot:5990139-Pyramimonas_sp.AAC.1
MNWRSSARKTSIGADPIPDSQGAHAAAPEGSPGGSSADPRNPPRGAPKIYVCASVSSSTREVE